jgi:tRNA A37 methylthiotransferase MiaB
VTVLLKTYGCRANLYDTEAVRTVLELAVGGLVARVEPG